MSESIHGVDARQRIRTRRSSPLTLRLLGHQGRGELPLLRRSRNHRVDPAGGAVQTYVEDCRVSCRPWQVHLNYDDHGVAHVWVEAA